MLALGTSIFPAWRVIGDWRSPALHFAAPALLVWSWMRLAGWYCPIIAGRASLRINYCDYWLKLMCYCYEWYVLAPSGNGSVNACLAIDRLAS